MQIDVMLIIHLPGWYFDTKKVFQKPIYIEKNTSSSLLHLHDVMILLSCPVPPSSWSISFVIIRGLLILGFVHTCNILRVF